MGVEDYHVIQLVGEGSFGQVYKARIKLTGQIVAMKFILKHGKTDKDIQNLRQEIEILRKLKHENIVQMHDSFESPEDFCVVMEFAQGDLFEILEDDKCLPEEEVQVIAKQLVRALHYLHSNRIIHRDMKPQNILITAGSVVKVCDFGFARAMSTNTMFLRTIKGTPLYMAPELVREQPYNHTADLWSLGVILYELYVGQPPFYTHSVYALIRHIVNDPVKYPDEMSSNFKNFLKGLLNKESQNRLTWPALLEHPFVKETSDELGAREIRASTAAARECDAVQRGYGGRYSDTAFENSNTTKVDAKQSSPNALTGNSPLYEELPGFVSPKDVKQTGNQALDRIENVSLSANGAQIIGQDNKALALVLLPLKTWSTEYQHSCRDQDVLTLNQSLRIISNLTAAGAIHSNELLDEILRELLDFAIFTINLKSSVELNDLTVKSLYITKLLLENNANVISTSFFAHWVALTEIFTQVVGCIDDIIGKVLYESCASITSVLSIVAQSLKLASAFEVVSSPAINETVKKILDHTEKCGLVDHLCFLLEKSGSNSIAGSSETLPAACHACKAIWSLIDSFETLFVKGDVYPFPLNALRSHSSLQLDSREQEVGSRIGTDSARIVDTVTRAFLKSESIQLAIYNCLHQRQEAALCAAIQILQRCCLHNGFVPGVFCGLPTSLPVGTAVTGGGDGTIVSEIFSILSMCTPSSNKDSQTVEKTKLGNSSVLVLHSCLILAAVAQCLKSTGRNSAVFMLTTSLEKQQSRLSALANHFYPDEKTITQSQPHCSSAMLALASILVLESGASVESSIPEIAMSLIPGTATLCERLKISYGSENEGLISTNGVLSDWNGLRDGCVGLIEFRLRLGGQLAAQQLNASGIPLLLMDLLANSHVISSQRTDSTRDYVGLSPNGVVWAVSSILHCLSGEAQFFRQILMKVEHIKLICDLISDMHLKLVRSWGGPGGGYDGIRDTVNAVVDLLVFPFVATQTSPGLPSANASVDSSFLLNTGSAGGKICMEDTEMVKAIEEDMGKYLKVLLEAGVPAIILRCLEYVELKDLRRPVAFLGKMINRDHPPIAFELVKRGLLDPNKVKSLLDSTSLKEVILDVLMIISDLAHMDKVFYDHIDGASVLPFLKEFLIHEDPNIRAKTCCALGNMCRHSSYFYSSLANHHIIDPLIDRCSDSDKHTRKFACFAIGNAAYFSCTLYEELRRSIPQLANLLLLTEEDKTKANAAGALGNLVRHSNKLCEDIVSKGAMKALLKLVVDYSEAAFNPSKRESLNKSPLPIALVSLAKMCAHPPCRQFLHTSELFPVIDLLRQSSEPVIANFASKIANRVVNT